MLPKQLKEFFEDVKLRLKNIDSNTSNTSYHMNQTEKNMDHIIGTLSGIHEQLRKVNKQLEGQDNEEGEKNQETSRKIEQWGAEEKEDEQTYFIHLWEKPQADEGTHIQDTEPPRYVVRERDTGRFKAVDEKELAFYDGYGGYDQTFTLEDVLKWAGTPYLPIDGELVFISKYELIPVQSNKVYIGHIEIVFN